MFDKFPAGRRKLRKKKKIQKGWVGDIKLLNKSTFLKYREKNDTRFTLLKCATGTKISSFPSSISSSGIS